MLMSTKELDKGYDKYLQQVKEMKEKPYIKIGIMESAGSTEDGITIAGIASVHEFGSKSAGIPERSFIRSTMDEKRDKFLNITAAALIKIGDGADVTQQLGIIGLYIASEIKKKIVSKIPPPNAPETIKRKGSSTPLIDTGRMLNSITHLVVGGDK